MVSEGHLRSPTAHIENSDGTINASVHHWEDFTSSISLDSQDVAHGIDALEKNVVVGDSGTYVLARRPVECS